LVELPDPSSARRAARIVAGLFRIVVAKIGAHRVTDRSIVALALQGRERSSRAEQADEKNGDSYKTNASIEHVLQPPED
jgi:hypothetical protein